MAKIKLVSLYGVDPEFEKRTPINLSEINNKSFIIKFDRLNSANQFKHVWGKSNILLANIIKNLNSKKGLAAAKELAIKNMFGADKKLENNMELKNNKTPSLKMKK